MPARYYFRTLPFPLPLPLPFPFPFPFVKLAEFRLAGIIRLLQPDS